VLAASTHLSVHLPNGFIQETVRAFYTTWYQDLVTGLPHIEGGTIVPAEAPGHGVELNPELFGRPDTHLVESIR
jgi:L-alanine-DL-glutamate epimerase-like enolase superfamily enzyme